MLYIQAYKGLKALVASAILSSIDPVTGTSPTFQAMGYTPGPLREEPFLGPLPAAAQQVEEVLASATVHLPELVAKAADVQVGGCGQSAYTAVCVCVWKQQGCYANL